MEKYTAFNEGILFVDDEEGILSALKRELHGWARENQIMISTANSAAAGLDFLDTHSSQTMVLVSDLRMPVMKGSDFLLLVREKWPDIVTILLTGYSETEEVMKAVKAGIFSFILKPWDHEYLQAELAKAVELFRLKRQNALYMKTMEEELKWAGEMQKALLKPSFHDSGALEFKTSYRPVPGLYCGGDYYDILNIGKDEFLVLLGDVAGHGAKAAFVTGILKAVIFSEYVRHVDEKKFSPAAFLGWLNDRIGYEFRQISSLILTMMAVVISPEKGTITYSNAGQNYPFVLNGAQSKCLDVSGSAIGFSRNVTYEERTEPFGPNSLFLAYTDGLVEAGIRKGVGDMVSMEELLRIVPRTEDYHHHLREQALLLAHANSFSDDVTIVTVGRIH